MSDIKPIGKLKRIHFLGSWDKLYIDEHYKIFKYYLGTGMVFISQSFPI